MKSARLTLGIAAVSLAGALGASPAGDDLPPPARSLAVADMDPKAEACTDFYQYAVGGWLEKNPIPSDRPRWGSFDELRQRNLDSLRKILEGLAADKSSPAGSDERKLGDFYGACMDEAAIEASGIKPIEPALSRIAAIRSLPALREEIARLQTMGVDALFQFGSEEDRKDSSKVIAAALQGGLGMPDRDYYTKTDAKSQELRVKYVAHLQKMLELGGAPADAAAADAKAIMELETKLAEVSQIKVDVRNPDKTYHPMTVAAFAKEAPNYAWPAYFAEQKVPAGTSVNVWQPSYFQATDKLLTSVPLATWKAYLRWRLLAAAAPTLTKAFVDEDFAFNGKTLAGTPEIQPRWKRCVASTDNAMGMALGRVYVKEYFPPEAKKRADELVKNLLLALTDDLQTLSWMGESTKKAAAAKVAAFLPRIGYPNQWRDYSGLSVARSSYAANVEAATQFEFRRDIAKIGKPTDVNDWGMTPATVNASYNPAKNALTFPAGILQPPFFYPEGDDAINYGSIGGVIGHEITHGFDNSGRKFDAHGNQVDWWTEADAKAFEERAKCIVQQFDGYYVEPDLHQNGELVQGESIADLGGLTIAHRAYRKSLEGKPAPPPIDGFSADQRFFLAWARIWASNNRPEFARLLVQTNEHPLGKYRAVGTVVNMPEFAKAFSCSAGAPMIKEVNCQIW